jgi:GrpB-like predicted nucleotidyltransferase (UPF0157 family)
MAGITIQVVDYDAQWPGLYLSEAKRIREVLGSAALQLEHVGSTSVPGLAAKPVLDILLTVTDSALEAAYAPFLEQAGYRLIIREPAWFEHRLFRGPRTELNLHVFSAGCEEVERMLLFRDWLRQSSADRELYAKTKFDLASRVWTTVDDYAQAKSGVVAEIMARALEQRKAQQK